MSLVAANNNNKAQDYCYCARLGLDCERKRKNNNDDKGFNRVCVSCLGSTFGLAAVAALSLIARSLAGDLFISATLNCCTGWDRFVFAALFKRMIVRCASHPAAGSDATHCELRPLHSLALSSSRTHCARAQWRMQVIASQAHAKSVCVCVCVF